MAKSVMRLHVLGLPHTQTTKRFSACAFTEKIRKFCNMMHDLGHEVFLYAGDENEARVNELITVMPEADRLGFIGDLHYTAARFDAAAPNWMQLNSRAIEEIGKRIEPRDFICIMGGLANKPVADAFPAHTVVEYGIGYGGSFAKFRVWESLAWMHTSYGAQAGRPEAARGNFFDAVIPGYFEPDLFPFRAAKDDYFLFVGRMTELKGPGIAEDMCRRLGVELMMAGPPGGYEPTYGKWVGEVGPEDRGQLMGGARALIMPTLYVEPFGNVAVEAQASGTPVITTAWGAMTETVLHGETGWHCRTLGDFLEAASPERLAQLWPADKIRDRVMSIYSTDVIARKYEAYFERLLLLWGDGWNSTKSFL